MPFHKTQVESAEAYAKRIDEQRDREISKQTPKAEKNAQSIKKHGYVTDATIYNWDEVGDRLVKEKRYKEAYQAYMVRCNSSEGANDQRIAGCEAGSQLRLAAKKHGINTNNW